MKESKKQLKIVEMQFANAQLLPEIVKLLDEGHTVTLQLRGVSMRPFLEDKRDKALLIKAKDVKVGDPVLAETSPSHYVLHRVIQIDGNHVALRGDGNLGVEMCEIENIKASVVGFYRKGRKKLDRTDGLKWKIYSKIWTSIFPLRRYLLAVYRRIWIPVFGAL